MFCFSFEFIFKDLEGNGCTIEPHSIKHSSCMIETGKRIYIQRCDEREVVREAPVLFYWLIFDHRIVIRNRVVNRSSRPLAMNHPGSYLWSRCGIGLHTSTT
ncbi:hypothetical protein EDEG_00429 [Edhazardia aedis USNM 41457]|uniref:Uncharacterized protein n=1 Tax=Edhazardia aedis (strain USNM 41457) TaxID=1003232 RepID=J8ZP98_EDHAE|nr:hypothetical protein EDEG_00429 [Edhazardia aedis USNM 41457]|eukprot:EJW01538.1 hypothetical protein EDEG_00429 [Edhazardia aedis USNM 41457]